MSDRFFTKRNEALSDFIINKSGILLNFVENDIGKEKARALELVSDAIDESTQYSLKYYIQEANIQIYAIILYLKFRYMYKAIRLYPFHV
ncbi:hypothetical protein Gasu2_28860 [Galdieria sulphuraria]|nr:hypothetical protein Gasu2_28860 [Galdieria sulphuraria]